MKKFFAMMLVALAATAMVSCEKENDINKLADNTVVYDGKTYTMDNVMVDYYHPQLTLMRSWTNDTLADGSPTLTVDGIHLTPDVWNKEFDLTNQDNWEDGISIILVFTGAFELYFESWYNGEKDMWGNLDGTPYQHESIFSSGTYHVTGNNDGTPITITVDGKLKNGKTLQMKLVSDTYRTK